MSTTTAITLLTLVTLAGAGTWYSESDFGGNLMACNCQTWLGCDLRYDPSVPVPWLAVDTKYLVDRDWQCGDRVKVTFIDSGLSIEYYILDTGDLARHSIASFDYAEIVVDVSEYYWPMAELLSARVRVVNLSYAMRLAHFVPLPERMIQ